MVGPILTKLFAMIFDKRLNEWAEQHGMCVKGQVRFCKNYRNTKCEKKKKSWCFIVLTHAKSLCLKTTLLNVCRLLNNW
jgi:hypothetical protein